MSYVKRYFNTTSSGISNESQTSITGQVLASPPAAHSAPPQTTTMLFSFMKQFEGSASWARLSPMPLPRYFWLPRGPLCCCYKLVASLLEPHQQRAGFWLFCPKPALLLMPHTDERAEVHGYVPWHGLAQIHKDIAQNLHVFIVHSLQREKFRPFVLCISNADA